MTNLQPPPQQHEIERLREMARLGASRACSALGSLIARPVHHTTPRVHRPTEPTPAGCRSIGIVFEAEGDLSGLVAIVLPEDRCCIAVERMLGRKAVPLDVAESALRELGNIIASHTVSAMADALDATILLSLPKLSILEAGSLVDGLFAERSAQIRLETDLIGPEGGVEALLVFVPEPPKPESL